MRTAVSAPVSIEAEARSKMRTGWKKKPEGDGRVWISILAKLAGIRDQIRSFWIVNLFKILFKFHW